MKRGNLSAGEISLVESLGDGLKARHLMREFDRNSVAHA